MGLHIAGQLLLVWALGANLAAGYGFFQAARGQKQWLNLGQLSYHVLFAAAIVASALLYYLIFTHNFAFEYVYGYSDSELPFFYLLSAFWGGQEGTYLLWLLLSVAFGYAILRRGGQYTYHAMTFYALVNLFFTVMLLKVSPFAFLEFYAPEGAGLNPLLQDPWMVIHPPMMFVGYAMAGVPFALAMAALVKGDYSDWIRRVFPWAALVALFLAAGNILGGYWAYKTLGWGGYWAWDPVENSSLVPWFASLALLHGLVLERRSGGALRRSNLLLAAFTFWLVIYGTFLTRSGVLSDFSVHSFIDLGQNSYLVGFLALYALITLVVFAWRQRTAGFQSLNYNFWGKPFSLFAAMTLLFIFSMIVLVWSSLPILTKIFGAEPRAADIGTYNSFALPIAIIYSMLLTLSPLLTFKPETPPRWRFILMVCVGASAVAGVLIALLVSGANVVFAVLFTIVMTGLMLGLAKREIGTKMLPSAAVFVITAIVCFMVEIENYLYMLFFSTAMAAVASNVVAFVKLVPGQWRAAGAHLTHFGFGIMLVGVLASSAYDSSDRVQLDRGQPSETYGLSVTYEGMEHDIQWPKNGLKLAIVDNGNEYQGRPQFYFSERMRGYMKRPYIQRHLLEDIYFSPQDIRQGAAPDEGLVLSKQEPAEVGGYRFHFVGFDMGEHESQDQMKVTARVIAQHGNHADTLLPARTFLMGESGATEMDHPAEFGHEPNTYFMSIKQIMADQGAVMVDIPGLLDEAGKETLLMDVSRKPLINLVWLGTTLIMLGGLVVFYRRRKELGS